MRLALPLALLAALPYTTHAQELDDADKERGWSAKAEFGLAIASGNADSETANGKFAFVRDGGRWFYGLNAAGLRAKADDDLSANRFELGGKYGYKFTPRAYWFGSFRHDRDDFAAYEWQTIFSTGLGYTLVDSDTTSLVIEGGPGLRRTQPIEALVGVPPVAVPVDAESDTVLRASLLFSHELTDTTTIGNDLLVESGGGNTFVQNDLGVAVQMSERFALKAGYQLRRNSEVPVGVSRTDRLFTTNLVVGF